MKAFRAVIFSVFVLAIAAAFACGAKNNQVDTRWEGDNMKDFTSEGLTVSDKGAGNYERTPYEDRLVGMAYTTWHRTALWKSDSFWARPSLGEYRSDDAAVIEQHGKMLGEADVDFVFVDWSNNVAFNEKEYPKATYKNIMNEKALNITGREDFAMIERSTVKMFDIWSAMQEKTPQIAIMIGCPDRITALKDGGIQGKADQVYDWFLSSSENPSRKDKYMMYEGKPLLIVYLGTPTFVTDKNPLEVWNDDRFTVRYVTGFITEQPYLYNSNTLESIYGYWSWEDRQAQTFAVNKDTNRPEAMTVVAAYRSEGKPGDANYIPASGRQEGKIFKEEWARARLIGVNIALVVSWNEFVTGEQIDEIHSKDIEPNTVYGNTYFDLLKDEIRKFKNK